MKSNLLVNGLHRSNELKDLCMKNYIPTKLLQFRTILGPKLNKGYYTVGAQSISSFF
jgi:hypothetical protein